MLVFWINFAVCLIIFVSVNVFIFDTCIFILQRAKEELDKELKELQCDPPQVNICPPSPMNNAEKEKNFNP